MIKDVWDNRAANTDLPKELVTHADFHQRRLEIEVLLQYLPRNQKVLDIGCGNGYSTAAIAETSESVLGIDYSSAMIERARRDFGHVPNLNFETQDILQLDLSDQQFDAIVTQRCLINLPSWEDKKCAIENIARIVKSGGCFIFQEGTQQGREQLNQIREIFGLERMPSVPFNTDFDETELWPFIRQYFEIIEIRRFGLYDLISRVVHPLLVYPDQPQYDDKINEIAQQISAKLSGADQISREFIAYLRRLK